MVILRNDKFSKVIIHPTVLLGIVDHLKRVIKQDPTDERVIGALLGTIQNGEIDVTNSFGMPFKEKRDEDIWVLDVDYAEEMLKMIRKVTSNESIVGWYQTGTDLQNNDVDINERFKSICPDCIILIVDPSHKCSGIPAKAFIAVNETHDDGSPVSKTFQLLEIVIQGDNSEEIGVEHLLREMGKKEVDSLIHTAQSNISSLKALESYINNISKYLRDVLDNKLPMKSEILERIQAILYDLPLVVNNEVRDALQIQYTDDSSVELVSVLLRTVLALNAMINNKFQTRAAEKRTLNNIDTSKTIQTSQTVETKNNGDNK